MELGKVAEVLSARGFAVSVFSASGEAAAYLNREIDHTSVGFGGSMSVEALGLYESLGSHNELYSHWHVPEGMSVAQIHEKAAQTKIYLCSANALAETGEIVNIDGHGNRLASTLFGHEKVFFVIGRNKIVQKVFVRLQ